MKLQYHCENSRVVLTQACRVASVAVGFLWSAWYRWHAPVFLRNVFIYCCPTLYIPFICYQYCIFVPNIHLSFFGFGVKGLEPIVHYSWLLHFCTQNSCYSFPLESLAQYSLLLHTKLKFILL